MAYAIYRSEIPIISAVGHEPDVTISDFVADLRAATPSNAAELAVPDRDALRQILDGTSIAMATALRRQLKDAQQQLVMLAASPALQSPQGYFLQRRKATELLSARLLAAQNRAVSKHRQRFLASAAKLDALSPLKVLTRGYAMVQTGEGMLLRSVSQTGTGDAINITLTDGVLSATVNDVKENAL